MNRPQFLGPKIACKSRNILFPKSFSSLKKGDDVGSFNTANTLQQTQCSITEEEAVKEVQSQAPYDPQPDALPDSVDKWNFVNSGTLDLKDVSKMMSTILSAFVLIIIYGF